MNRAKAIIVDLTGYGSMTARALSLAEGFATAVRDPAGDPARAPKMSGMVRDGWHKSNMRRSRASQSSICQNWCGLSLETGNPSGTIADPGF